VKQIIILLLPLALFAAPKPKVYDCYPLTDSGAQDISIDGRLDEQVWRDAAWSDDFVDIEGDMQPLPILRTRVKMLRDDQFLYIAAELEEPHVWATITERDKVIFHDNDFEVFLDPDGDGHQYGELEINAHNTQWDLFLPKPYKDNGHALNEWNIEGLKSAVHINGTLNDPSDIDSGWTLEIALPWRGLEMCSHLMSAPDRGSWRINFSRVEWDTEIVNGQYHKIENRPEHNWVWSPQGVINMHRPEMWGVVAFVKDSKTSVSPMTNDEWRLNEVTYDLYYAQHVFIERYGWPATTPVELGAMFEPPLYAEILPLPDGWTIHVDLVQDSTRYLGALLRDDALYISKTFAGNP
jgi:hypothetical protein